MSQVRIKQSARLAVASDWVFNGRRVFVPNGADIPTSFRPGEPFAQAIQAVLKAMDPHAVVATLQLDRSFCQLVVSTPVRQSRIWAVHRGHHARVPGLSPFVQLRREAPRTRLFTVHLEWAPHYPMVVRAYPGDEIPPLLWMNSASFSDWQLGEIRDFWRTHAYVLRESLISPGTQSSNPPRWFSQ